MASATKSFLDLVANSKYNTMATAVPEYWGAQMRLAQSGPSYKLYADGVSGNNGISIDNAQATLGTKGQTINSGGSVYAGGMTLEKQISGNITSSATFSAVGSTFNRLEYTDTAISGVSARDSFFSNTSSEQEQCLKAQCAVDFENDKITVGGFIKRCEFSIDQRNSPDTLDSLGKAVLARRSVCPLFIAIRSTGMRRDTNMEGLFRGYSAPGRAVGSCRESGSTGFQSIKASLPLQG